MMPQSCKQQTCESLRHFDEKKARKEQNYTITAQTRSKGDLMSNIPRIVKVPTKLLT